MNLDFTGSTLFLVLLLFAAGLVCIIKGGDIFVDAATWIAEASGIPKFIIGATVVSFATTMPEMLVSVFSALEGNADIAVGNAVGSVTANTGLIMCLSLICMECTMPRRQYAVKAVLLLAAIAVLFGFTRDGQLSILESVLILVIFVCFIAESLVAARREQSLEAPEQDARCAAHAALLQQFCETFSNCYLLDFRTYAPVYDAFFYQNFAMGGHLNPAGYLLTGKMVASYIDYIIRHNIHDFDQVGFIGTQFQYRAL